MGVSIVGGPSDGENIVVSELTLYRVAVQNDPTSPEFHYVNYKFDWALQFFVLDKE